MHYNPSIRLYKNIWKGLKLASDTKISWNDKLAKGANDLPALYLYLWSPGLIFSASSLSSFSSHVSSCSSAGTLGVCSGSGAAGGGIAADSGASLEPSLAYRRQIKWKRHTTLTIFKKKLSYPYVLATSRPKTSYGLLWMMQIPCTVIIIAAVLPPPQGCIM